MRSFSSSLLLITLGVLCFASVAQARDFFVDPVRGSAAGDGSIESPWRTLEEVFANQLIETRRYAEHPYREGLG